MTKTTERRIEINQVIISDEEKGYKADFLIRVFETVQDANNRIARNLVYTKADAIALAKELLAWAEE